MPRVGSSMIRTFGLVDEPLASTTFCWLPPDRNADRVAQLWNLSCSLVAQSAASLASEPMPMTPNRVAQRLQAGEADVALDAQLHHQALLAAVLGHEPDAGLHGGAWGSRA